MTWNILFEYISYTEKHKIGFMKESIRAVQQSGPSNSV